MVEVVNVCDCEPVCGFFYLEKAANGLANVHDFYYTSATEVQVKCYLIKIKSPLTPKKTSFSTSSSSSSFLQQFIINSVLMVSPQKKKINAQAKNSQMISIAKPGY